MDTCGAGRRPKSVLSVELVLNWSKNLCDKKIRVLSHSTKKSTIFAAANVERFDLIATTRKNAKPMLFPTSFSQQLPTNLFIN